MAFTRDEMRNGAMHLTRKEKDLLELFENNPGRCFSRPYLLKRIWGYSNDTKTRTVDVHVSRLRKKLAGRGDVTIHTVVRQGYCLQRRGTNIAGNPLEADFVPGPDRFTSAETSSLMMA